MSLRRALVALNLTGLLVVGGAVGALGYRSFAPASTTTVVERPSGAEAVANTGSAESSSTAKTVGEIYAEAEPGVVEVTVVGGQSSQVPLQGPPTQRAQGSGFVLDSEGHIVTNQHVVDGAESISVRLASGKVYEATLVGSDASSDIAVLEIDAPAGELSPLELGDSEALEVGDAVVAIGSPFGLEGSATAGIVSALGREITAPNRFQIDGAIQTDAAINHGNSGGPLLDMSGKVVGVNAQIESDSGGNDGVGFAIPATVVSRTVEQLIANGRVDYAYLGVALATIEPDAAEELGVPAGVAVTEVRPGSPAARAGLEGATGSKAVGGESYPTGGDIITKVDGDDLEPADRLQELVAGKKPGDELHLTVSRGGNERTVKVTLGTRPA